MFLSQISTLSPTTNSHSKMSPLKPTPLSSLHLTTAFIPAHTPSHLPNNPARPLLIYHAAYPPSTPPSSLESHLRTHGLTPQWRYTMYRETHYHSTTHEVLCVYRGRAKLLFGGEQNPARREVEVCAGDAMVVPAGVGHRLLEDLGESESGEAFAMVGSYPGDCQWDMCFGREDEEDKVRRAGEVAWLERDPLYGEDGPALWGRERLERGSSGGE